MQEKVWNKKKNGMVVLVLSVLVYAVGIFMTVLGGIFTENGCEFPYKSRVIPT